MGEKDETITEGEKKSKGAKKAESAAADGGGDDGGKKEEDGGINTIILKLDLHCDGCAKKVKRSIKNYDGVEEVKVDPAGGKLTVKGNVDANWLRNKVELKTKKKVELIVASQPQKDAGGGGDKKLAGKVKEKKPDDKVDVTEKKPDKVKDNKSQENVNETKPDEIKKDDDNKLPKQAQGSTVVLKIPLHCDGCAQKIRRIIKKIDGVENVTIDNDKDLVTVEGTMDMKELLPYLKQKLKRSVDIVSPKKDVGGGGGGGEKKGKEAGGGGDKKEKTGGDKKEKAAGGDEEQRKEKQAGGGSEEKKKKKAAAGGAGGGGGVDEKEKAVGGDKKEKEGNGGSKEKEVNTNGEGKKEKEGGGGGDGGKKEKGGGGGGGGGEKKEKAGGGGGKQVNESKAVNNDGGDKIDESKVEVNKLEYQGYGQPYTHYGVPMYNQSYANQDYGLVHTMYNNPYHASTSYVTEYNHQPPEYNYYQPYNHHQPYHRLHHIQQPQVPPPPPPTYLPPPQDHMFSDENPNACSTM